MHVKSLKAILKVSTCHEQGKIPLKEEVYSFDLLFIFHRKIQSMA